MVSDAAYIDELNCQIRRHPTSFAGKMTQGLLDLHREAYPIDTHFDSISGRFQLGGDFEAETYEPGLSKPLPWLVVRLFRCLLPHGQNKPLFNHANREGFNLGMGGAVSCGHANLQNILGRWAGESWSVIEAEHENLKREAAENENARLCSTVSETRAAAEAGARSLIFAVEGAHCLGASPWFGSETSRKDRLANLADLKRNKGAAYITLDHYCGTDISRAGVPLNPLSPWGWRRGGLTEFGERVVERAIDLGLVIDLAHSNTRSVLDTCRIAKRRGVPVLASHAGSRRIMTGLRSVKNTYTRRMLSDAAIKAIVETGGCIGVVIGTQFLVSARFNNFRKMTDMPLSTYLDHYEKLANLIGFFGFDVDPWNHLCFGTDFDGGLASIPWEIRGARDLPLVTLAMRERGWPDERIKRVYSENFLRVWSAAETGAVAGKSGP